MDAIIAKILLFVFIDTVVIPIVHNASHIISNVFNDFNSDIVFLLLSYLTFL